MNQVPGQPYGHGGPQYYQPAQHQQQSNQSYGNVYYTTYDGNHASLEAKRRREILQDFVGMIKRNEIDANSYSAVSQRLVGLHGLQLPLAANESIPEYQHAPAMVGVGGPGGYQTSSMPPQMYQLPPMNLRTKADLMNIDRVLEQMQSTVYEGNEAAAAGVGQPGAHFIHGGATYNTNNSPPNSATQLPSSHATATTSAPVSAAPITSAHSPHNSTPALTPPSSAQSYTSARSPTSISSTHQRSPLLHHQQAPLTSAGMYPTLPAPNAQESYPSGYPASSSSAAPVSTLGGAFDNDDRRRYTGGTLQRSRPAEMKAPGSSVSNSDKGENSRSTPTKDNPDRQSPPGSVPFPANLVDPALRSHISPYPPVESPGEKKNSPSNSATASPGSTNQDDSVWVENIRIIECLRQYVSELLERGIYEHGTDRGQVQNGSEQQKTGTMDVDMGGTGASRGASEGQVASPSREVDAGENLYPILKALEGDDGDVKMGSNVHGGS